MYYKAVSLQKDGQRTAAVKAYKDFIAKYPHHDKVEQAHKNLRTLGMDSPSASKRRNWTLDQRMCSGRKPSPTSRAGIRRSTGKVFNIRTMNGAVIGLVDAKTRRITRS